VELALIRVGVQPKLKFSGVPDRTGLRHILCSIAR
jgi:hypothetical protein